MVITRTTRNRLIRKGPWVRIPPSPSETIASSCFPTAGYSFLVCCKSQTIHHCIGRCQLRTVVQMRIDICCSRKVTMTKPLLDIFQSKAHVDEQTCATMPLRYNNDKPEKPRNFKGLEVYQADFSSFSNPKNQATKPLFRRGC